MTKAFRGTYTVMITPFDAEGGVDLAATADFVDWQIAEGIHGLVPLGSTGEFLSLTDDEKAAVAETVIRKADGRVPVLIGTGAESTDDVIRYSRQAEQLGADGVMIIPPFYSTPTEDELFEHYRRIGEAISLPIMIYNNPATANVDLTPRIVERLSRIDNVRYIKESTMDVTRIRDILDFCGDRMTVFGGIMGFESFLEGAEGWVAVGSNIMPREMAELFSLWADRRDFDGARALYHRVLPVIRLVAGHRYVSGSKAALAMMGRPVGGPRPPRLPLPEAELPSVAEALTRSGVILDKAA
ncbi:4-hydroxy-tetrahydrodipicolinate synthase [Kaistia geumhonensis]|uniref:4-hydroxy-tetrahydrodipicolinate synthase n=1 Tax=Kaistia geumhonensis TaxID=410839 RepID=A0ABU0M9G3_9HYPH|nr:4-hydroxy-tetrahydrodipicolinate synthase [Kaistia geumhonensis]MCX5480694.1 4-hydroxy-tetrahydrodipicolinate synthase [Kaistia geumhonensis]MDQ0517602.1 4-hydroxy-tetrahydrodipicolinate synthase [Kaistia geumhonensis]